MCTGIDKTGLFSRLAQLDKEQKEEKGGSQNVQYWHAGKERSVKLAKTIEARPERRQDQKMRIDRGEESYRCRVRMVLIIFNVLPFLNLSHSHSRMWKRLEARGTLLGLTRALFSFSAFTRRHLRSPSLSSPLLCILRCNFLAGHLSLLLQQEGGESSEGGRERERQPGGWSFFSLES